MQFDYSLESMLPFARAALASIATNAPKTDPFNFEFKAFCDSLFVELEKSHVRGVVRNSQYGSQLHPFNYNESACPIELQRGTVDVFSHLLHRGFVTWIAQGFPGVLNPQRYRTTNQGASWATGANPLPEDVAGYMRHLLALVPSVDSVIKQYVEEGLGSFQRGSFLSAAVMLGAASEMEIYLLGGSLVGALKDTSERIKLAKLAEGRKFYQFLDSIGKHVERCKNLDPIFYGSELHLMSLFESIRVQRNDAVHPKTASVNEESVRLSYGAFPYSLQKAEAIQAWLNSNPGSV